MTESEKDIQVKNIKEKFINSLSSIRKSRNLTQGELGIPQMVVSRIENHLSTPNLDTIIKYMLALGIDINDIFKSEPNDDLIPDNIIDGALRDLSVDNLTSLYQKTLKSNMDLKETLNKYNIKMSSLNLSDSEDLEEMKHLICKHYELSLLMKDGAEYLQKIASIIKEKEDISQNEYDTKCKLEYLTSMIDKFKKI